MNHWDLTPGELVTLRLHDQDRSHRRSDPNTVRAVFRFHTTRLACFETIVLDPQAPPVLLQFEAMDDGSLCEVRRDTFIRRHWNIVGLRRDTRTMIREPLGQTKHFTLSDCWAKAAAKGVGV